MGMTLSPRSRGFPLAIAALLLASLVALAILQWRWIGEVSAMDRQRLRGSLAAAAARYADDFDREVTRAFVTFLPEASESTRSDLERRLLRQYDQWSEEAAYPRLIRAIYVVSFGADREAAIEELSPDAMRFAAAAWRPELEPLRRRLTEIAGAPGSASRPDLDGAETGLRARVDARLDAGLDVRHYVFPEVPALRIPLGARAFAALHDHGDEAAAHPSDAPARPRSGAFLLIALDPTTISEELLPDLTREHFGSTEGADYALAVTTAGPDPRILYRSDPAVPIAAFERADIRTDLLTLRPFAELHGRPRGTRWRPDGAGAHIPPRHSLGAVLDERARRRELHAAADSTSRGSRGATGRAAGGGWSLAVASRDGSLEAAVAAIRRRNLAVSSGILAVLAATTGILMVTSQRARRLARQQIEFVAGVTHELHTPLTAIRSAGENLADGVVAEPVQVKRYGRLIESEGRRLSAMVGQLLEFAGIQSGRRSYRRDPIAVADLVDRALADTRWRLEEAHVDVQRNVEPNLRPVLGDPQALRQAVQNLIENAIKYGGPERWLGVTARRAPGGGAPAHDGIEIVVADRGPGIPPRDLPRVFEPFYRGENATASNVPGSGLGLSLVRHIVEAHGGTVSARRGAGEPAGTIVTIRLPAPFLSSLAEATPSSEPSSPASESEPAS